MKTKIIFLALLFVVGFAKSQTNVNADCINAIPLCSTPSFTFFATSGVGSVVDFSVSSAVSNPTNDPFSPNAGCLKSGELNPQWLLLTVGNAGLLEFVFGAGNSANPQAGFYDWSMWPYSPTTCNDILNNTLAPVRCNWNASSTGGTGLASAANISAVGGVTGNFGAPLQVNACQQFIICISNYSGVNTLVSFLSLGTASLSCNPNCNPNYSTCAGGSATIVPVNFASLTNPSYSMQPGNVTSTTGSFVVTPAATTNYTTYITGVNSVNAVQTITSISTVTVFSQPTVAPTLTQSTCSSSLTTVSLAVSFVPSPVNYSVQWLPLPNGVIGASQTSVTAYQSPGTYTAVVTTTAGCSASCVFTVDPVPTVPQINLLPLVSNYSLTCYNPVVTYTALDAANNYTWYNGSIAAQNGQYASFTYTDQGTWTITAVDPGSGCVTTKTLAIGVNTVAPSLTLTPMFQNITCNIATVSNVTVVTSPTVNSQIVIASALGGSFAASSYSTIYLPGGPGTPTCWGVNSTNGCSTAVVFTITSNVGFPTFNLSSAQNFTLGCGTKSVATLNINNGSTSPAGGAVSYSLLAPGGTTSTASGSLSAQSVYTVNSAGIYTMVTKDNVSFCETRLPVSILSNTTAPDIQALVPTRVLDCGTKRIVLRGFSETNNVSYNWFLPQNNLMQIGDSVSVNANIATPTNSTIGNYTLVITDNSSTCKSSSIIPMYQNLYQPNVIISNGGVSAFSCLTNTVTLTNQSNSGIPSSTLFTTDKPVIGLLWKGPTPMLDLPLSTTYIGNVAGVYTLTVKDLNNSCTRSGTIAITSNSIYPVITFGNAPVLDCASGMAVVNPTVDYTNGVKMLYSIVPPAGGTVTPLTNSVPTFSTLSLGLHRLIAYNTQNGCGASALFKVVQGSLTASFEADKTEGFAPLEINFSNTSSTSSSTLTNPKSNSSIASIWQFGTGNSSVVATPSIQVKNTFYAAGNYTVTMYAQSGGCQDSATKTIVVKPASSLEIPNVFTPNGDGVNDVFFIHETSLGAVEFKVSDRWGREVVTVTGNEGTVSWDGTRSNGKKADTGVYFYTLKASGLDGQEYEKSGNITLLR